MISRSSNVAVAVFLSASSALASRHFNIINNCPLPITLYINTQSQGTLASYGGSTTRDFADTWNGLIYTDFNHGNWDGWGTTRAGFYGPSQPDSGYYYVLKDPNHFNVGLSIAPIDRAPVGGFCGVTTCESSDSCSDAYTTQGPSVFPPPSTSVPPSAPLHACPQYRTGYTVTFCPSGELHNYDPFGGTTIQPNDNHVKCLDVKGGIFANGTPVQIYDCNGSQAQKWVIARGQNQIKIQGSNYCLDAGSTPGNGVGMKIWQCYDNLPAQQWFYTSDNRIQVFGKGQCLDLTGGVLTNGNRVQTWQCTNGNVNQIWR